MSVQWVTLYNMYACLYQGCVWFIDCLLYVSHASKLLQAMSEPTSSCSYLHP